MSTEPVVDDHVLRHEGLVFKLDENFIDKVLLDAVGGLISVIDALNVREHRHTRH
jgi:hypothetical protein